MLSFDPSDWTASVVSALIQIHNFVFESTVVDRQDEDVILEYDKGAVIVTTDRERCDLFNQRFHESLGSPAQPTEEEVGAIMEQCEELLLGEDWPPDNPPVPTLEKARVAIYFHAQDGVEMEGRRILGLYLVDREGVDHWAGISSRTHPFDDQRWTERIVAAQLLGITIGYLMAEAGTPESDNKTSDILLIEYTYLVESNQDTLLPLIKAVVLKP